MTAIGVGIGAPLGMFAGTYLAEYGRNDKLTSVIRFINDILLSAPSIIIGLFIYGAVVVPMRGFSAIAGALAPQQETCLEVVLLQKTHPLHFLEFLRETPHDPLHILACFRGVRLIRGGDDY